MQLNFASGQHPTDLPGWVDVDLRWDGVVTPDVYGAGEDLPFRYHSFDRLYLGHVLEHLELGEQMMTVMGELRRVCTPGAEVMVVGPDYERVRTGDWPAWLVEAVWTGEPQPGAGGHKWLPLLKTHLGVCRLFLTDVREVAVATVTPPRWPNPTTVPWQLAIAARMPD